MNLSFQAFFFLSVTRITDNTPPRPQTHHFRLFDKKPRPVFYVTRVRKSTFYLRYKLQPQKRLNLIKKLKHGISPLFFHATYAKSLYGTSFSDDFAKRKIRQKTSTKSIRINKVRKIMYKIPLTKKVICGITNPNRNTNHKRHLDICILRFTADISYVDRGYY